MIAALLPPTIDTPVPAALAAILVPLQTPVVPNINVAPSAHPPEVPLPVAPVIVAAPVNSTTTLLVPVVPTPLLPPPTLAHPQILRPTKSPAKISRVSGRTVNLPSRYRDNSFLSFVVDFAGSANNFALTAFLPLFDPLTNLPDTVPVVSSLPSWFPDWSMVDAIPILGAFAASSSKKKSNSDPDTLRYHEAMRAPDSAEFIVAMKLEITTLEGMKVWSVVNRSVATSHVVPGTWTFRR